MRTPSQKIQLKQPLSTLTLIIMDVSAYTSAPLPPKTGSKRPPVTPMTGGAASKAKPTAAPATSATSFLGSDPAAAAASAAVTSPKTKGKRNRRKLEKVTSQGLSDAEWKKRVEQWLETLGSVLLQHEKELNVIKKETQRVVAFEEDNEVFEAIENVKNLWDDRRVVGAPHPDGAFRDVALRVFSKKLRTMVDSSADLASQQATLHDILDVLDTAAEGKSVERLYLIRTQPKDEPVQPEKPMGLIVHKFDLHSEEGHQAYHAMDNLDEEGVVHQLMSATLGEDRAPMWNLCRAIQDVLGKGGKKA